jgi:hypothetical protein
MLRAIAAIFFMAAFAVQSFQKAVIVLDYYANTSSFAKNCENKVRPTLHCNGKCQMMKKLKEEEKKDQQNPERKTDNKNEVVSSKSFYAGISSKPAKAITPTSEYKERYIPTGLTADIFHPPALF